MSDRPTTNPHTLPDPLPIEPLPAGAAFDVEVRPPGSKSLTNRALLLAALASGESILRGALVNADDTLRMIEALRTLGADVRIVLPDEIRVGGVGGTWRVPREGVTLNLNNAGTATRFLAAAALLSPGPVTVDGNARMRQRPIGELATALQTLGARVSWLGAPGCPPMRIEPPARVELGQDVTFGRTQSSQFVSAVLLIGPWMPGGLTVRLTSDPTSSSYLRMSLELLARLGAAVRTSGDLRVIRVTPNAGEGGAEGSAESGGATAGLEAFVLDVEPDASSATYFWAAAALVKNAQVRIAALPEESMQGDSDFPELLARMGARVGSSAEGLTIQGSARLKPILADMSDMPDAAVTLAVLAAFADGTSVIRGVRTLRVKESDRIEALRVELAKVGVTVTSDVKTDADAMTVSPPEGGIDCGPGAARVEFDTYKDHRMAMALSLIGLRRPNVWIRDPGCVDKTFPTYWAELARLRAASRVGRASRE